MLFEELTDVFIQKHFIEGYIDIDSIICNDGTLTLFLIKVLPVQSKGFLRSIVSSFNSKNGYTTYRFTFENITDFKICDNQEICIYSLEKIAVGDNVKINFIETTSIVIFGDNIKINIQEVHEVK